MSASTGPDPAFPEAIGSGYDRCGMTLRDYFAAKAMAGMLSCQDFMNDLIKSSKCRTKIEARAELARQAYAAADAMLRARAKGGEG